MSLCWFVSVVLRAVAEEQMEHFVVVAQSRIWEEKQSSIYRVSGMFPSFHHSPENESQNHRVGPQKSSSPNPFPDAEHVIPK